MIKRLMATLFSTAFSRAFITAINLLIIFYISRYFSPSTLGNYGIAFFFIHLFVISFSLGVHPFLSKEIAHSRDNIKNISVWINECLSACINGSILTLILFIPIIFFYKGISVPLLLLSLLLGVLWGFDLNIGGILLGIEKKQWDAFFNFLSFVLLCMLLIFLKNRISFYQLLELRILIFLISISGKFYIIQKKWIVRKISIKLKHWSEERYYFFSAITQFFQIQTDIFILSFFILKADLGGYFLAFRIFMGVTFIAEITGNALNPFISRIFHNRENRTIDKFSKEILILALGGGILFAGGLYIFADKILNLINPELTASSMFILKILALAVPFRMTHVIMGSFLTSTQYQKIRFKLEAVLTGIYIVFLTAMIYKFSVFGAGWTRLLFEFSFFISFIIVLYSRILNKRNSFPKNAA